MKVDHTGKALDYGFTVEVKCQCRAGLCPKPPSTFGEGHVCSKPAGHDDYDGLHHTCANCGKDFNSLSVVPWAYKSMEDEDRAKLIRQRLETPNVQVQRDSGSIIDGGSAGTTGSAPDTNKERQAMSIDIVKRLRYAEYNDARLTEAAEEIERLREGLKIASAAVENLEHEVAVQRKAANEHRNAAMEADQRTQAAVRGEKQARASVERLHVKAGPLLDALDADIGGGLPDVDAWINAAEAVLRDVMKTPNVEVTGLAAASLPQGPCGLPGSAATTNEAP